MEVLITTGIFVVLLVLLALDLWSNHRGRSYPKHKLTYHK